MNKNLKTIGVLGIAVLLGACATTGGGSADAVTRAQARWDAQIAGEYETAYGYFSPGYRAAFPLEAYRSQMRARTVRWTQATVQDQACEENVCKVRVSLEYEVDLATRGAGTVTSVSSLVESWIESDGTWYLVPDRLR